ncbi:MAG TPA: outer membrane beta-barrel protein [Flavobacteriaceae bacterium]|nr:outer membrane beta-barrel protein [Flavobacteriaceae bacterium]
MKKTVLILLALFSSACLMAQDEQETEKESEFGLRVGAKMGFATLVQSDMVDLQGSANGGEILFYYKMPSGTSFSLGIEDLQFKANGVAEGITYSLDQHHFRIPLKLKYTLGILEDQLDDKLQAYAGIGVYANTLWREKIQTLEETYRNKHQGWNAGYSIELGLVFEVYKDFNLGIGFETQNDFMDMKKDDVKRKLEGITTVKFTLDLKF